MAKQEHLDLLRQEVEVWNQWRREHPDVQPDFGGADLREIRLRGADLREAILNLADLRDADLTLANLYRANIHEANLSGASLSGADLTGADLSGANLDGANLERALLNEVDFSGAKLNRINLHWGHGSPGLLFMTNLRGANLSKASLNRAVLVETHLQGASLREATLRDADLTTAKLTGADLSGTDLSKANLEYTNFIEANLSNAYLREANLTVALLWGSDLRGADLRGADLSKAFLSGAHLISGVDSFSETIRREASLRANLRGANLSEANLSEVNFSEIDCSRADLSRANLSGANLSNANLSNTNLSETNLSNTNFSSANLSSANLSKAILVATILRKADLTNSRIHGISVWDVQLEEARQDNLVITSPGEPIITVDNLEVAQFIYLLLDHKKLRDVLNAVTKKGVLILGRFGGGGLQVLQAIADKLRAWSYLPIIFDFERPQDHDYTETVKTLIGLVRFVVVDLSGPSVPQELYATVPHFDVPFVPIIEKGRKSYAMFIDLLKYDWVLRPPLEFTTVEELLARMPAEVIAPAEEKHQARQKLMDEVFKNT